jgi:hypothetical protein
MCHLGDYSSSSAFRDMFWMDQIFLHADLMIELLGKLPSDARSKVSIEERMRINGKIVHGSWKERFESTVRMLRRKFGMKEVSEEEKVALLDMLKAMCRLNL